MITWSAEIKEVEKLYESLKGQFPDLEKELGQLIKFEDPNVVLLYSRRCLEVIITDLCENELKRPRKTEPLKGIIDKLNSEEKVPSHIITSMDHLNSLSSYGTHPKDFDPEQVKPVLNNLTTIIKWYLKYKDSMVINNTKEEEEKQERIYSDDLDNPVQIKKLKKKSVITISGILITSIIVILILNFFNIFTKDKFKSIKDSSGRISVAVMPFLNMTNDTTLNLWQNGIQDNLITNLSNYPEDLIVRQTESINNLIQSDGLTNYASITPSVASSISQKLDANVFVFGSIKPDGAAIRLSAQLIDSKTKVVFKSFQINGKMEEILHFSDTLSLIIKNFLITSKLGKELSLDYRNYATSNSPEALRDFILGNNAFIKRDYSSSIDWYTQALRRDSNFVFATIRLSFAYFNLDMFSQSKKLCLKIYDKRDQMPPQLKILTNFLYTVNFETPQQSIKYIRSLLEIDDQIPYVYHILGWSYCRLNEYKKAIPVFEKAFAIYNKWGSKPVLVQTYVFLGRAYHNEGLYDKEKILYQRAERDFPDDLTIIFRQTILSLAEGDTIAANRYIDKYISVLKENSISESKRLDGLAGIYSEANILNKAEGYYRQALLLDPENPSRISTLAYFLINKDINIKEGLELIEKALQLHPDYYPYLHCKGLGLYKQGKYQEAFKILQKSWDLRMENAIYDHSTYLHLEAAKKAVAGLK
jgi:tetratricopeptide (TPR) repeat protein